jgi:precorrin-4 methylase
MEDLTETKKSMAPFLRELANSIETEELTQKQLILVAEFYMSYQFQKENSYEQESVDEFDKDELMKFIFIGWYIYKIILEKKQY